MHSKTPDILYYDVLLVKQLFYRASVINVNIVKNNHIVSSLKHEYWTRNI